MSHTRFPRVGRLRKGYHPRQVDKFLNHVEVSLSGLFPLPTATEVRQVGFEMVRHGYEPTAVDLALDALEERVLAAQSMSAGRRGRLDPASEAGVLREELDGPYMKRFPRAGALHRGYDVDDVDDFVDRVLAALSGQGRLTVEDVRSAPFRPRRGGYREDAVDQTLDRVVEHLMLVRRQSAGPPANRPSGQAPTPLSTPPAASPAPPPGRPMPHDA